MLFIDDGHAAEIGDGVYGEIGTVRPVVVEAAGMTVAACTDLAPIVEPQDHCRLTPFELRGTIGKAALMPDDPNRLVVSRFGIRR